MVGRKKTTKDDNVNSESVREQFKQYCRNSAITIILLGLLHLFVSSLSFYWGLLLLGLGFFSFLVRKKAVILLLGVTLILAGFFNALDILVSGFDSSNLKWAVLGIVQFGLGISEIIKYVKLRRFDVNVQANRVVEIIGYIVLGGLFLLYLYIFLFSVPDYTLKQTIDGQEIEVFSSECETPFVENWNRCCILSTDYDWLCEDEGEDYDRKLDEGIESGNLTSRWMYDYRSKVGVQSPEGYVSVINTKEGGIHVPFIFLTTLIDQEGNYTDEFIFIKVMSFDDQNYSEEEWMEFENVLTEGIPEEEIRRKTTKKGYEFTLVETVDFVDKEGNAVLYQKIILFEEPKALVTFTTVDNGKKFVNEFDELIESIQFG